VAKLNPDTLNPGFFRGDQNVGASEIGIAIGTEKKRRFVGRRDKLSNQSDIGL